ncbi:hypothetical protein PG997_009191, partial [Apiospora hydei]
MSGLEPIAALSLACNILQIVGIGRETVRVARQVYQDGKLDPALTEDAGILNDLAGQIHLITAVPSAAKPKAQDKRLLDLADKCQGAARDLQEEVNFLNGPPTRAKLVATLKTAAKTTWRKRRLEKLDQKLKDAENLLQAGLLTRLYERSVSTDMQLSSLNADFRDFIYEYRQGFVNATDLTRKHITRETKRSEDAVKSHVTETSIHTENSLKEHINLTFRDVVKQEQDTRLESKRDQLLRSLKFDRMNERRNQVSSSHPSTLAWLLRDGSEGDGDGDGHRSPTETSGSEDDSDFPKEDISWDSFTDWLRSTETVYWISGKPGSGKSTVAKYLPRPGSDEKSIWINGTLTPFSSLTSSGGPLLSEDITTVYEVHRTYDIRSSKDNEADWSSEELQNAFHYVLSRYPRPVVMFLDGLDEVLPKDGALRLLEIVDSLKLLHRTTGKLKLCLGSRREPVFCKRLCAYPQLRLEQLNRGDLRRYGRDHIVIPPDYHIAMPINFWLYHQGVLFSHDRLPNQDELKDWLVSSLVEKAQGVFLWLCLTAKEIKRALNQDDTVEALEHLIHTLPGDLVDLYADMWARTNHDNDHLRARAASYLQLAVSIRDDYAGEYSLSPFIMMVATTPGMADLLLQPDPANAVPVAVLIEACETTRRDAANRCAGLLECPSPTEFLSTRTNEGLSPWHDEEYKSLIPYVLRVPVYSFIHRTARDFLIDTEAGQRILNWSSSTGDRVELQLMKARLTVCRLFRRAVWRRMMRDNARTPDGSQMLRCSFSNEVAYILLKMSKRFYKRPITSGNDESVKEELFRLFLLYEQLFNYGYLYAGPTLPPKSLRFEQNPTTKENYAFNETTVNRQYEFLIEAAMYSCFAPDLWDYLLPVVVSRNVDGDTLSQLLVHACSFNGRARKPLKYMEARLNAIHKLLEMGASLFDRSPRRTRIIHEEHSPITTIIETPFKALIMSLWDIATHHATDDDFHQRFLELISLFVTHGADLQEEVYVALEIEGGLIEFRDPWHELSDDGTDKPSSRSTWGTTYSPEGCVHILFIMGCPASAMISRLLDIWKPKTRTTQTEWHSELQKMAKPGLEKSHPIALVDMSKLKQSTRRTFSKSLFLGDMSPLGSGTQSEQDLLPLVRLAEEGLEGANLERKDETENEIHVLSHVLVSLEIQAGVARAVERMKSDRVPVEERRKEVRLRLGICTPWEEPDWLEFSSTR